MWREKAAHRVDGVLSGSMRFLSLHLDKVTQSQAPKRHLLRLDQGLYPFKHLVHHCQVGITELDFFITKLVYHPLTYSVGSSVA